MTTTMVRTNMMAIVAAMVMMVCVAQANARDYTVGASITVPLNMQNIMERGTLTVFGEMRSSQTVNNIIDASVTTVNNTSTETNTTVEVNTTNNTTNNTNHVHNNNSLKVSGHSNQVIVIN